MEVFDKPSVKLFSHYSTLPSSTAQLPLPPPDLAIEREKLISHGTVVCECVCVFLAACAFLWACASACLSAGEFHYPVADPLQ